MASPFGAIIGSAMFILIPDLLQSFQSYLGLVFALLLLGFIVLRPNGLASVGLSRHLGLASLRTAGGRR
jgi:branched-chain amino acid transport system permease protein